MACDLISELTRDTGRGQPSQLRRGPDLDASQDSCTPDGLSVAAGRVRSSVTTREIQPHIPRRRERLHHRSRNRNDAGVSVVFGLVLDWPVDHRAAAPLNPVSTHRQKLGTPHARECVNADRSLEGVREIGDRRRCGTPSNRPGSPGGRREPRPGSCPWSGGCERRHLRRYRRVRAACENPSGPGMQSADASVTGSLALLDQ